ncbi:hypothetical protein GJ689_16770 [Rhodoplanes serenus]|uniref:Uncharacterized protein n=1 Tax=Rhodoplanes serenus TaxID=200615 RepID=A0A9X4XSI5_9BRAD|nr:hypothetical protein [Rhodoplanes serenus]MTW17861.1 hypothetical protein [Rhodoplanes serenus]
MTRPATRPRRGLAAAAAGLALLLTAAPAAAHRAGGGRTDGIPIDSLSHGQMLVIEQNRAAILDLAARTARTDETFRRLLNYTKIQHAFCLFGLMPGTLTDEESPFNGCAHAYLAGTRALLNHMRDRPGADPAARALADKVDHALLLEGTLALCVYSGEPYNTADVILPEWSAIPTHRPTAAALGGILVVTAGSTTLLFRPRRRAQAI